MSYALTGLILLSQIGLPVHMHYCKGMLESVSVFFSLRCDDHEEVVDLPSCCRNTSASHCSQKRDNCCDDQVKVFLQDFDSLLPHLEKWESVMTVANEVAMPNLIQNEITLPEFITGHSSDSGPPIYILFGSLILYA
jgi:hypothetical protein